jgi:hypothetical protein
MFGYLNQKSTVFGKDINEFIPQIKLPMCTISEVRLDYHKNLFFNTLFSSSFKGYTKTNTYWTYYKRHNNTTDCSDTKQTAF